MLDTCNLYCNNIIFTRIIWPLIVCRLNLVTFHKYMCVESVSDYSTWEYYRAMQTARMAEIVTSCASNTSIHGSCVMRFVCAVFLQEKSFFYDKFFEQELKLRHRRVRNSFLSSGTAKTKRYRAQGSSGAMGSTEGETKSRRLKLHRLQTFQCSDHGYGSRNPFSVATDTALQLRKHITDR